MPLGYVVDDDDEDAAADGDAELVGGEEKNNKKKKKKGCVHVRQQTALAHFWASSVTLWRCSNLWGPRGR